MKKKILFAGLIILILGIAAIPLAEMKGNPEAGKKIYENSCLACHGKEGKGEGSAAAALDPKPKSFSDPGVTAKSDKELFDVITKGSPGTVMISFEKILTEQQRWDVLAYIRSLGEKNRTRVMPH